jgi:hypothetical protein
MPSESYDNVIGFICRSMHLCGMVDYFSRAHMLAMIKHNLHSPRHIHSVTKKEDPETRRIDAISHGPWFSHSINPPQIHRHLTFPDLDYLLAIAHQSTCNLKTDKPSNTSPDTTHTALVIHYTQMPLREKYSDIIHGLYT